MPTYNDAYNVTAGFAGITGLYASDTDTSHATANSTNLNLMIVELLRSGGITNGKGGTLVFPAGGTYYFDGGIIIGNDDAVPPNKVPSSIILRGSAEQNRKNPALMQLDTTATFFTIDNKPSSGIGDQQVAGIVFEDLIITFNSSADDTAGIGVYVTGGSSARIQRVVFDEVPNAAVLLNDSLHCSIIDCNIRTQVVQNGIGIQTGLASGVNQAKETYVAGTTLLAFSVTGGTGVLMYGADHFRMANCRIEGWANGINIDVGSGAGNVFKVYFGNVGVFSNEEAAWLQVSGGTSGSPSIITQVWFAECEFGIPNQSSTTYTGGGVVIGPTDANDIIDQIRFVDCYSSLWLGPGMDVQGGTNLEILGGHYSCNGTGADLPYAYSSSGIVLSGPASGVRISNVACNNSVFDVTQTVRAFAPATQDYGIYVTGGATSVRINGCDLTGNETNGALVDGGSSASNVFIRGCDITGYSVYSDAVAVSGAITSLQVTDCAGYNDRGAALVGVVGGGTATIKNYTWGYHGPVEFYTSNATGTISSILINSHNAQLQQGSFFLMPGETGTVSWGTAIQTIHLLVIGK